MAYSGPAWRDRASPSQPSPLAEFELRPAVIGRRFRRLFLAGYIRREPPHAGGVGAGRCAAERLSALLPGRGSRVFLPVPSPVPGPRTPVVPVPVPIPTTRAGPRKPRPSSLRPVTRVQSPAPGPAVQCAAAWLRGDGPGPLCTSLRPRAGLPFSGPIRPSIPLCPPFRPPVFPVFRPLLFPLCPSLFPLLPTLFSPPYTLRSHLFPLSHSIPICPPQFSGGTCDPVVVDGWWTGQPHGCGEEQGGAGGTPESLGYVVCESEVPPSVSLTRTGHTPGGHASAPPHPHACLTCRKRTKMAWKTQVGSACS